MSRQWAQKKSSSNSSMSVQKSSSSQRPFTAPVYDAPAPTPTPSVQAKRRNVDWSRVTVEAQSPAGVQAKLSVGAPGDKYEQEADAMANKVMTMPAPENAKPLQREMAPEEKEEEVQTKPLANSIQREMAPEEKEEEVQTKPLADSIQREMVPEEKEEEVQTKPLADSIQREMVPEEKEEEVQTKPATEGKSQAGSNLESQLSGTKGGGNALSDDVRSHMEPRFGANFSSVRVHTDSAAVQMNRDLGAQAFTHGSDIYYGGGKSPGKDELTAHELTHVVQQKGGAVQGEQVQRKRKNKNKGKGRATEAATETKEEEKTEKAKESKEAEKKEGAKETKEAEKKEGAKETKEAEKKEGAKETKEEEKKESVKVVNYNSGLLSNGPYFEHINFSDGSSWSTKIASREPFVGKHVYLDIREGKHKGEGYSVAEKNGYNAQQVKEWLLEKHPDLKEHWKAYREEATKKKGSK